jgi:hypothetical protein
MYINKKQEYLIVVIVTLYTKYEMRNPTSKQKVPNIWPFLWVTVCVEKTLMRVEKPKCLKCTHIQHSLIGCVLLTQIGIALYLENSNGQK